MGNEREIPIDILRRTITRRLGWHLSLAFPVSSLILSQSEAEQRTNQRATSYKKERDTQESGAQLPIALPETLRDLASLKHSPSQYLLSEKLDGVRAYWDGKHMYFRSGRVIPVPAWFTKDFPNMELDGELWMGRGQFELLSAAVRRQQAEDSEWKKIRYCLFELPHSEGNFAHRYGVMKDVTKRLNIPWLSTIEQRIFQHRSEMQAHFDSLMQLKAEGIVLHLASAKFESGRNQNLLKYKPYYDAEAQVLKHLPGTGKLSGKMGALLVENRDGVRFKLGSGFHEDLRTTPPALGSWVTYRYRDITSGAVPRFATYLRPYEAD